jgi:DNA-binding NarL/FixJ family response regulator
MVTPGPAHLEDQFDPRFKLFHELMSLKVREVLLISSLYDAWVMEEDCRLSEAIINEYRGLNLSHPPRLNWVSSPEAAIAALKNKNHDLVIIMPRMADMSVVTTAELIRAEAPKLPIMLLCHHLDPCLGFSFLPQSSLPLFSRIFYWRGNSDLLLAMIKNAEDQKNVAHDTKFASIRVIIFVEDSPEYLSALLPMFYRELVIQTQAVMEEGLNEEHRLLAMRARPKILVADNFEGALKLFRQYEPYVLGVISDVRFPRHNKFDENAGVDLLRAIRKERFDIPMLLMSSEARNAGKAADIPAVFVDKNSPTLLSDVQSFFLNHLGFGDFVFRSPLGHEIARAPNLRSLEKQLQTIPDDSFAYHCNRNDFSRWLFARSEIELATRVRPVRENDFSDMGSHRRFLVSVIHERRMQRQRSVVVDFDPKALDEDSEFLKIGTGSLGGKARGLSFASALLRRHPALEMRFNSVDVLIPQTLVVTTEVFCTFIEENNLKELAKTEIPDEIIADRFMKAQFPERFKAQLAGFLSHFGYPLAVRSSSLLEDAQFRAYAGLYKTYMLPNDNPDLACRLEQLILAIKMVYASTYFQGPKAFALRVGHRTEEEKMAVIIQRLIGGRHKNFFYPAFAGIAQSHNYYPFADMKPEDGIATIALGLGKAVMDGEKALRFSPHYPEMLPQRSTVDDVLDNSQRFFYALKLDEPTCHLSLNDGLTLARREIMDALDEGPVKLSSSTYVQNEHSIRDSDTIPGYPVITFAQVLKYGLFPLADILKEVLAIGEEGMGCPVELEFSVNLNFDRTSKPQFAILQLRPMSAREEMTNVDITSQDLTKAFCISTKALGNRISTELTDIIFVKPDVFDPGRTPEIAGQIGQLNKVLMSEGRKYVLIGPGRWGSTDRWLGIPVSWADICGVSAIIETAHPKLNAEPSQGSHFFHNIISLGINYMSVQADEINRIDWRWLMSLPIKEESEFVSRVLLEHAMTLKVDGRRSQGVLIFEP